MDCVGKTMPILLFLISTVRLLYQQCSVSLPRTLKPVLLVFSPPMTQDPWGCSLAGKQLVKEEEAPQPAQQEPPPRPPKPAPQLPPPPATVPPKAMPPPPQLPVKAMPAPPLQLPAKAMPAAPGPLNAGPPVKAAPRPPQMEPPSHLEQSSYLAEGHEGVDASCSLENATPRQRRKWPKQSPRGSSSSRNCRSGLSWSMGFPCLHTLSHDYDDDTELYIHFK